MGVGAGRASGAVGSSDSEDSMLVGRFTPKLSLYRMKLTLTVRSAEAVTSHELNKLPSVVAMSTIGNVWSENETSGLTGTSVVLSTKLSCGLHATIFVCQS